jgi:DNA-binding IclR family transcriptional regulator
MLTVSRSVDRVFQILELFGTRRRPLSATEVRQALQIPHSSAVSVLSRLVTLGYLDQNGETKRFFPSLRLHRLCEAVPEGIIGGNPLARLVDSVQAKTEETTSVSRLHDLFTMPIYSRTGVYPGANHVTPGIAGGLATLSVVGRTLLSTLPNVDLRRFIERAEYWARRTRVSVPHETEKVMRSIEFVREHGYLCSSNLLVPGVAAVSCPLPLLGNGERLAITVAGAVDRIERRSQQIIGTLQREVREFQALEPVASPDATPQGCCGADGGTIALSDASVSV